MSAIVFACRDNFTAQCIYKHFSAADQQQGPKVVRQQQAHTAHTASSPSNPAFHGTADPVHSSYGGGHHTASRNPAHVGSMSYAGRHLFGGAGGGAAGVHSSVIIPPGSMDMTSLGSALSNTSQAPATQR